MMLQGMTGTMVTLRDGRLLRRRGDNRAYLMSLKNEHLLRNYELEAGRFTNREIDTEAMGGWESSTCQLRGHFLGHWLSAAALHYSMTGDVEIKGKADAVVQELALCQRDNGGQWVGGIPEKYLYWIGEGRQVWAPQYTLHKILMGLVDMYRYAGNEQAVGIADRFADWFYDWSGKYTEEEFADILDFETSGMLEVWADLLEITEKEKYRTLLKRYYRGRLFDALLAGKDALTNMHANTTIPEILGCARAYEVTGEERWLAVVEAYWKCAVTDRGSFATGGQTQGEIWTPKFRLKARLGDKNQEHCTVYNMMRLADFLFRKTGEPRYLQYMEYNLYNGVMAQTYYESVDATDRTRKSGLITYFLPMKAGSRKSWAGRMDAFFCCHGTMVQANARLGEGIWYREGRSIYLGQYIRSEMVCDMDGKTVQFILSEDPMNGLLQMSSENNAAQTVNDVAGAHAGKPDFRKYDIRVRLVGEAAFCLKLRVPEWVREEASVYVNGELVRKTADSAVFIEIERTFADGDQVSVLLPIGLSFIPLPDAPDTGAFRYGPEVLVGITDQERILYLEDEDPAKELSVDTERQWGEFLTCYRTENQDPGISFLRINEIGYEPYQMYFKIKKRGS